MKKRYQPHENWLSGSLDGRKKLQHRPLEIVKIMRFIFLSYFNAIYHWNPPKIIA